MRQRARRWLQRRCICGVVPTTRRHVRKLALEGVTGGDWVFANEITFHLFRRALYSMQRRKAVGAGGMTIELLLAGGREVQHLLYRAVRDDAMRLLEGDQSAAAPEWQRVLYVLL